VKLDLQTETRLLNYTASYYRRPRY